MTSLYHFTLHISRSCEIFKEDSGKEVNQDANFEDNKRFLQIVFLISIEQVAINNE